MNARELSEKLLENPEGKVIIAVPQQFEVKAVVIITEPMDDAPNGVTMLLLDLKL